MNIGIVGSGNIGRTLGHLWAKAGHKIFFSFSRDTDKLDALAKECGNDAKATTPYDAVRCSEVVLFSVPWDSIDEAVKQIGRFEGQTVIDTTNDSFVDDRMNVQDFEEKDSSSECVARKLENAQVIKAFNTLRAQTLEDRSGQGLVVFMAGDNPTAKSTVAQLIQDAGFVPFDAGPLVEGKKQQPGTDRFMAELTPEQAQRVERGESPDGVRSIVGEIDLDQPVRRY